jgi:CIC family chloride channel protein
MSEPAVATAGLQSEEVKRRHILPKALAVGVVAGLIASGFRMLLQFCELGRIAWIQRLPLAWGLVVALGVGALGSGFGLWLVRRFAPETAGSGIPDLQSVVLGEK